MRRVLHEGQTPRPLQEKATSRRAGPPQARLRPPGGRKLHAVSDRGALEVVPTVIATHPRKAVGKDAAFQILAKHLLDIRGRSVMVALAVELSGTGQLKPSLEVLGNRAVQQGALGVAGVVGFGGFSGFSGLSGCGNSRRLRA